MAKKVLPTLAERLAERTISDGECIIWQGATAGKFKYGQIKVNGRMRYCHRLSYQLNKGDIPAGMLVMHTCDRPACINPEHLVLGTQKNNMDDMRLKGREPSNKGEQNGRSILTAADVDEIRSTYKRYCRKFGAPPLAKRYGVGTQAILDIIRGKNWIN